MTSPRILKELGLLPRWRLNRAQTAAASPPQPSPQPPKPLPQPPPKKPPPQTIGQTDADEAAIAKMDWARLHQTVRACQKCALCERRKQAVFGVGDTEADIFIVGEGPGAEEDRRGEPFVGAAGKLLDKMLAAIGLSRERGVYVANVVKCRPPQNRTPKQPEAAACLPYLHRQIALARPKLIVALGRVAAAHLCEDAPIAKLRQRMREYRGVPVVVSYHPAYLLRSPAEKRKAWEDLKLIKKLSAPVE